MVRLEASIKIGLEKKLRGDLWDGPLRFINQKDNGNVEIIRLT